MTEATPQNIAEVRVLLPNDATTYGWDDAMIAERWTGGLVSMMWTYWYERTSDTAGYLDLSDASGSLPITQIHRQAKEMLEYWDAWWLRWGDQETLAEYYDIMAAGRRVRFGKIKNRYPRPRKGPYPVGPDPRSPYQNTG